MNLHKNHEFYSSKAKIYFLMLLNFGFHILRPVERNLDTYKSIV